VLYVIKRDKHNKFLFAPLQSDIGKSIINEFNIDTSKTDSILLFTPSKQRIFHKSTAALLVAKQLNFPTNLLSIFFHKNEPYYSAVGASGAVTGILYAAILLQPNMQLGLLFIPIPLPAYVLGIGYLLYSIYGMKNRVGNIGHSAHFGGAIGGYVTALLFKPSLLQTDTLMVVLLALPILALFALQKLGKLK
jgi:hypothetical protein